MDKIKTAEYCSHAKSEQTRKHIGVIIDSLISKYEDIVFIKMELAYLLSEFKNLQTTKRKRFKYLDTKIKEAPNPKDRLQPRKQKRVNNEIDIRKKEIDNLEYAIKYLSLQLKEENLSILLDKQEKIVVDIPYEAEETPQTAIVQKFDPNKKVYSRVEACEFLNISNRKLTTLLSDLKIKPVSYTVKPYTFNIEELERYRKEEM